MILIYPAHAVVYLIVMGIDITVFFLVVRLVLLWCDIQWLASYDEIGRGVVDRVTISIDRVFSGWSNRRLSKRGTLIVGITILAITRHVLTLLI